MHLSSTYLYLWSFNEGTRASLRMVSFTAAISAILSCASDRGFSAELIQNGSFEEPGPQPGSGRGPFLNEWDDGPGIGNDRGFGIEQWPFFEDGESLVGFAAFGLPPGISESGFTGALRPAGAGNYFGLQWGAGNGRGLLGAATQFVDLASHQNKEFSFSAWLAGRRSDPDYAVVTLTFFDEPDASGLSVGSIIFDGDDQNSSFIEGSLSLEGTADPLIAATQDNWTLYRARGVIPDAAQSASVTIMTEAAGEDGLVDLVSLQVVPEPSSAVLACLLGAVGVVWSVRRKIC